MTNQLPDLSIMELKALIREAVREELDDAGLRIGEPESRDEAREDFRFLRLLRKRYDSTVNKVGTAVVLAIVSALIAVFWAGFKYLLKA